MENKLQYAIKDNNLIHIDEVQNGLACSCTCPSCGKKLVAKKGTIKIFHFSHYDSEECKGAIETSLHMLAKEILYEEMKIKLPAVYVEFPDSYKKSELMYHEQVIKFDKVYLERKIDSFIPDVIIECKGTKLLVEIYVTHDVDNNKLDKIIKNGMSAISIDLSNKKNILYKEELKNIIVNDTVDKKWLYNGKAIEMYLKFKQKAKAFEYTKNNNGFFCPQYKYGWKGMSSARLEDCIECEFCFSLNNKVNCLGYSGVSKIEDLDNPELEQIARKLRIENKIKPEWLEATQCPKCRNGFMKIKEGKYSQLLGCSNYPECKHILKI